MGSHFLPLTLPPSHHLGTIFLWIFWPSFNSAPTTLGDGQHRTALNTYYSLTASTLSTFALSALVGRDGRLDMVWEGGLGRSRGRNGGGVEEERSEALQGLFSRGMEFHLHWRWWGQSERQGFSSRRARG